MKTKNIHLSLIFFGLLAFSSVKAQTVNDYINFYNTISPKLNAVASVKSNYIHQDFSLFLNKLNTENITIDWVSYYPRNSSTEKIYTIRLSFSNIDLSQAGLQQRYQLPVIWITFENEVPQSLVNMVLQYQGKWNLQFEQFFKNMKIEKIKFIGINGYNNPDRTPK
ncbi:hypothetical protein [Amniculibacterium sp. G2-70]|uniref:hypothetical protein n=1 Tax=Amniculibacterium sp. G2-70 TaxID=2767188 RepID=UPI0016541951|nr:hypothetical protein [Amniculibacterium sp. G2-70]